MTPQQRQELCEHLEGASAALEMALQTIDMIRDAGNLPEWDRSLLSDATIASWQSQRNIDRIMAKLTEDN